LTPEPPAFKHLNGGSTRQFQLFRRLIELGHEITVVAPFDRSTAKGMDDLTDAGMRVVPCLRSGNRIMEIARAVFKNPGLLAGPFHASAKDFIAEIFWSGLEPLVKHELSSGNYDLVMVEQAQSWLKHLPRDVPVVLELYEVESPQYYAKGGRIGGFGGLLRRINGRRSRQSEQTWLPQFDTIVTMSDQETAALTQIVPELPPTYAVGNGANPEYFALRPAGGHGRRVVFTGTMAYTPNRTAAAWLARDVWPLVRRSATDAQLEIVGRAPSPATRALDQLDGVTVTADPPTMVPFFESAHVCVVPMLEGGGTRLKLADAMAAGRAIVTTTNGATGVNVSNGQEVVIADGPETFAGAIVELLRDRELRERLGAAARLRAHEELDWIALGDRLSEILVGVTKRASKASVPTEV
jgi:glycosyltransferase involved in cell wall biosynthesis